MAMNKRRLKQAKLNGNFQGWLTKKKIMKIKGNTCCWCGCECTNDFVIIGGQKQPLPPHCHCRTFDSYRKRRTAQYK